MACFSGCAADWRPLSVLQLELTLPRYDLSAMQEEGQYRRPHQDEAGQEEAEGEGGRAADVLLCCLTHRFFLCFSVLMIQIHVHCLQRENKLLRAGFEGRKQGFIATPTRPAGAGAAAAPAKS